MIDIKVGIAMKELEFWLESEEFLKFLETGQEVFKNLVNPEAPSIETLQLVLEEMGGRYNHFIFQITESFIEASKEARMTSEEVSNEVLNFIKKVEEEAFLRYPKIMKIFSSYREQLSIKK